MSSVFCWIGHTAIVLWEKLRHAVIIRSSNTTEELYYRNRRWNAISWGCGSHHCLPALPRERQKLCSFRFVQIQGNTDILFPWSNKKGNVSKQQKYLAHCEFIPPAQQCRQHARSSPKTWQREFVLHPYCIYQTARASPLEILSPLMSLGRTGKLPREAHAGFILAPCGLQHFADASYTTLTLICLPFCNAAWALSICVVNPVCLPCYPSGAGRCHLLYFSDHKYFSRVPEEQPFYRYFTNISYFCFIQTPHPCIISV